MTMTPNMKKLFSDMSSGKKLAMSIVSLLLVIAALTLAVVETTKATVTVIVDGEETVIQSHAETVAELMVEHDLVVGEHDELQPSLETEVTGNMVITWKPAKQVFVTKDGETEELWTVADNVAHLISQLDINRSEYDEVTPSLDTKITDEMEINYETAFQASLKTDGEEKQVWTTSTTVADFLESEGITLGELDRVEPAKENFVTVKNSEIEVIRVEKVTDVVEESVAYATVTRRDSSLDRGKEKVIESGSEGRVNKHYEVVLENGEEVSRELVKTEEVKDSQDRIVAVGTKTQVQSVSRGSSPTSSQANGKTLTVTATAYTANCAGCSGVTATGINLNNNRQKKVIAVDPNVIPLGSRVYVEGYGNAVAGDTGGAIKGRKIDLHVPTKREAYRWGVRKVKVTILE